MTDSQVRNRFFVPLRLAGMVEEFSDDEKGKILTAMIQYHVSGTIPEFSDRSLRMCWRDLQAFFDTCAEEYDKTCRVNRLNGRLGGRPKGSTKKTEKTDRLFEKPNGYFENRSQPKKPDIDIEKEIDNRREVANEQSANLDSSPADFYGHIGLPVGSPPLPMNFKKWNEEQFQTAVKQAATEHPELEVFTEEFIDYWTEPLSNCKPRFSGEKSWDTTRRLRRWATHNEKFSGAKTASSQPAKKSDTAEEINRRNAEERAEFLRQLAAEEKEAANVTTA